jgi:tRNA C32,U32 (ribose-2'-O)-methylase TrmJ
VLLALRRVFERTQLEVRDVRLLRGIARQLSWALQHPLTLQSEPADSARQGSPRGPA